MTIDGGNGRRLGYRGLDEMDESLDLQGGDDSQNHRTVY
jgi:hypothetical protein